MIDFVYITTGCRPFVDIDDHDQKIIFSIHQKILKLESENRGVYFVNL